MADNILKLKVESSEYDAKLKKAAEGIRHLADVAHQSGGELTGLEKSELDYVKALGEMDTKSRTAAGSVRELESSYKELKVIYDQLNEVEKADEGGKALAASLEQIKQRAQEAKAQLESASQSLSDNGQQAQQSSGLLDALASKFTLNIDALKLFDMGLSAVNMALDVAKDAFMSSEANVDEWGRVMDSSKSLYEGFLTALNTGDISGYLSRIDSIVQAARTAYNELDRLGTMKTIQAPKMSAQQTENERMRMMIQTGRYIAPVDGRKASMQNGQLLTPDQIKRIEQQLQGGMQKVVTLVGNEVAQTGRAIDAVYNRQAQELGMSLKEFRKGTSSMAEFDKRMAGYDQYQKWREKHTTIDIKSGRETVAHGNPFEQFAKWGTFRVDGQRYNDLVKLIQQRDQQAAQAYSMQSQAYRTMNRAEGVTLRQIMGGGSVGGGVKSGSKTMQTELQQNQAEIAKLTQEFVRLGDSETEASRQRQAEIQKEIALLEQRNGLLGLRAEQAQGRFMLRSSDMKMPTAMSSGLLGNPFTADNNAMDIKGSLGLQLDPSVLAEAQKDADSYIDQLVKGAKQTEKAWGMAGQAVQGIGSAFAMIDDPAAKVAGTVMQAIASVALGFAMASKSADTVASGWGWLAWLGAGATAMATTIATIHSLTGYASGGVIKGNSYSGDNIMGMVDGGGIVGLNAGEIVLNKAQTANVANELTNNQPRAMRVNGRISGHDIVLAADRSLAQEGKGHIVTWK